MYPVPVIISGYEKEINYPAVCPRSPKYGLAFCDQHFSLVERKGIPVKLKPFLEYCNKKNKGNFSECIAQLQYNCAKVIFHIKFKFS